MLRIDSTGLTQIFSCDVLDACRVVRFHKDGGRVYIETNRGSDLIQLELIDIHSGKCQIIESDPHGKVDFGGAVFSKVTEELVFVNYEDQRPRKSFINGEFEADYRWLQEKLPHREIDLVSRTDDELLWLIKAHTDTEPGETYLFDRSRRELTFQFRSHQTLPREALCPMQSICYKSSDSMDIPAYLILPHAMTTRSLPLVVMPHGGPWNRDVWCYAPTGQFFANRGYAVLMPNFRGSVGYGKAFLNAGNGEWGRKMQDDITWGVKHLVENGIADPNRIGIFGSSYGGYAALAGVTFTPDLFKAAVAIASPSNLITLLTSLPPHWEAMRNNIYARIGDPTSLDGRVRLKEASPLFFVANIRTPLMVVHGEKDTRVLRSEAEQMVAALRDRGMSTVYLLMPDEGHGFARQLNRSAVLMAVEEFFAKHIGGRHQPSRSLDAQRLKEIAVDRL